MITEELQDEATLYALALLDDREATAFERALDADAELHVLVTDLRETVGALAWTTMGNPPPGLRERVLSRAAEEKRATTIRTRRIFSADEVATTPRYGKWLPWTVAAAMALCCGALTVSRERWRQSSSALEITAQSSPQTHSAPESQEKDPLRQMVFCSLEPLASEMVRPRVMVLWDAVRREGKVRAANLPLPEAGKDYQLWVVEAGHKNPISAGIVSLDKGGGTERLFRPVIDGGKESVAAFALSLERAGGSPTNAGPVLFLGKL